MTLQIYNTLARKKEEFKPINPPKVGMYVCGVTVYDECHLGHARALVNFDVIFRYLKYRGYDVTFVRNFTDVDDKIIERAARDGVPWNQVAEKYIVSFGRDMQALGNQHPTIEPKATENMEQIIQVIQSLLEKGYAYKAGSDVFYAVRKKTDYGKLSGKKIDELESGVRVEIMETKKDPLDFALWKASKPGEPSWLAPWGQGRPGWHIECSAMSMHYLGETFDIHGGGRDLSFPHHENEIAQSEAATGKPFARYWVHNGFVNINAEKMSKSLGNFLTIHEILKKYNAEVVRLFILGAHYRSPLDYTEKNMNNARQSLERFYTTVARIKSRCTTAKKAAYHEDEKSLAAKVQNLTADFEGAMDDDFNSAKVTGLLFDLVREWNKVLDEQKEVCGELCRTFLAALQTIHGVFGIFGAEPEQYLEKEKSRALMDTALTPQEIGEKLKKRADARRRKNWQEADAIRDELQKAGVQFKDNPDGTTSWTIA